MFKHPIKLIVFFCLCLLVVAIIADAQIRVIELYNGEENLRIMADDTCDNFGARVAKGDINGDGYDDVIIGALTADTAGGTHAGETYVIFGHWRLPSTIDLNSISADMIIYGDDAEDLSGSSVYSGDINGDGYDDVIIGAHQANTAAGYSVGETYVIFGSAAPPATVDLNSVSADITIYGDDEWDHSGFSVSSGDINGDGYDDVIIGAHQARPGGRIGAGETYVIFGSAAPPAIIDLNSVSADMTIYGDDAGDHSGFSVSSGDINGDGYDDVIIGAYLACPLGYEEAGSAFVIFGGPAPPAIIDLSSQSADMAIYGGDFIGHTGYSVSSGDINNDGFADVIIGAPGDWPPGGPNNGAIYVFFGSASPPTSINLLFESADMSIYYGHEDEYEYKNSVSSGDINGDGYDDVIIGVRYADTAGGADAGETYVIYGSDAPPATVYLNGVFADMSIYGDDAYDYSGNSVSSGDINGDGYDDVIVGAFGADTGETYVIYGNDLPIMGNYDFKLIKTWPKVGGGQLIERDKRIILRQPRGFFQVFPKGALSDKCDIETKIIRRGGRNTIVSSSILFSYQDKRNYWEFKMLYTPIGVRRSEKLILRHKKNGVFEEKIVVKNTISRREQYMLHIEVRKDQIRVMIDDMEIINITPSEKPAWGNVALGMRGDGACIFEDLNIY
jgi:hypothetical protein